MAADAAESEPLLPADVVSFETVYRAKWWLMLRLAQGLVDDVPTAEDVVQEAFAGLYGRWSALRDPDAAVAYLRTSVVNASRSALRRRRTVRDHVPQPPDDAPAADEGMLMTIEQSLVRQRLAALPRRQREVLTLRLLADLTDEEIAASLGISAGGVRSAASRGLAALRSAVEVVR